MKTRITGGPGSCYHVFSRIVERRFYLGDWEKEAFASLMWRAADFSGVNILTFCVMDNHFHILVQVPERVEIDDVEMLRRLKVLYGTGPRKGLYDPVGDFVRSEKYPVWREKLRQKYLRRMYDLSEFMRTLKLRYSFWYNRNHEREGTLWDMRFKSVLVQGPRFGVERGAGNVALATVAAYIDLNSVRAGLVEDPKDYRWCGYAGAVAGDKRARRGLQLVYGRQVKALPAWMEVAAAYRSLLFVHGQIEGEEALPQAALLRCRVRYFTRGAVLGSQAFVDQAFARHRWMFSSTRKTGARRLRGDWKGMCAARDVV
jgi:hypothetical protein